jgi:hypothetical protein
MHGSSRGRRGRIRCARCGRGCGCCRGSAGPCDRGSSGCCRRSRHSGGGCWVNHYSNQPSPTVPWATRVSLQVTIKASAAVSQSSAGLLTWRAPFVGGMLLACRAPVSAVQVQARVGSASHPGQWRSEGRFWIGPCRWPCPVWEGDARCSTSPQVPQHLHRQVARNLLGVCGGPPCTGPVWPCTRSVWR